MVGQGGWQDREGGGTVRVEVKGERGEGEELSEENRP